MRLTTPWIIGAAIAAAACSKSDTAKEAGETPPGGADTAKATPAGGGEGVAKPSGPATIVQPPADLDVDPCALVTDEEVKDLTGELPPGETRLQSLPAMVGANPERLVASCKRGRVSIELGGSGIKPGDYEDVGALDGIGDEAKHVKNRGNNDLAWVKIGDRVAVVGARPKVTQGGDAARKAEAKKVEKIAKLVASRLGDLPAYEHRKADAVGGPAKDPCELLSPDDVALATGPVEVVQVSSSIIGDPKRTFATEKVECSWRSTTDADAIFLRIQRPVAFEKAGGTEPLPAGPTIAGVATKLGETVLGKQIVAKKGDYAVSIELVDRNEDADALLHELTKRVFAELE